MRSLHEMQLESNRKIKIDFNGGDLSSDSGLFLLHEYAWKMGLAEIATRDFRTTGRAVRKHRDTENLEQVLLQIWSGYFQDDNADELSNEPVMKAILKKERLASQPTLSRFYNRMDVNTLRQLADITTHLRRKVYKIEQPEQILFDLDTTLLPAYGHQEGNAFNSHYRSMGYHPLLCYDGLSGDLLKAELRNGAQYCGKGVAEFMRPLFEEYRREYPQINMFLRGDSGFAMPELYSICEEYGCGYVLRLKSNTALHTLAAHLETLLYEKVRDDMLSHAEVYGEFEYQAGSWEKPRRVVCKIEKPANQFTCTCMFIVTNMKLPLQDIIRLYCQRGVMENFIKEGKSGFDFGAVSSATMEVNANRLALHMLAYNLFNWFRRMVLPEAMRKLRVDAIRLKLLKVASRVVITGRYLYFRLCSSCPYQWAFQQTLWNIQNLPD